MRIVAIDHREVQWPLVPRGTARGHALTRAAIAALDSRRALPLLMMPLALARMRAFAIGLVL